MSERGSTEHRTPLERAFRTSRIGSLVGVLSRNADSSAFARTWRAVADVGEKSRLHDIGERLAEHARQSFLYRWLTAEPDPDIVTIDLRETWTVGPVIAALETLVSAGGRYWSGASVGESLRYVSATVRAGPIRALGWLVTVALTVNIVVLLTLGTSGSTQIGLRLLVLAMGLLGTRSDVTWTELRDGPVGRTAAAVFAPPEPPDAGDEGPERGR